MRIAYVRVSTAEQNEQRQIDALAKHDIERWFTEKVSGKDTNRPQLQAMLEFAREGDGWLWEEPEGDNRQYTRQITEHWYWYDVRF